MQIFIKVQVQMCCVYIKLQAKPISISYYSEGQRFFQLYWPQYISICEEYRIISCMYSHYWRILFEELFTEVFGHAENLSVF